MLSRLFSIFSPHASDAPPKSSSGGSSYLPGLDGLRALSVIAVLIYHARPEWLPGGFIGVEVFFVISGFIITRALLNEWREHGRIGLVAFWMRRARRLLPAVALLLVVLMAYVVAFEPGEATRLRLDALAALAYVTNWHLILGDQSYFDSFQRPSMLRHLWSLAVEEQFYLVWPLVLGFGLPILRHRGLLALIVGGIVASAVAMALLYDPIGDNSRAYFGSDTRAAGLLAGSALAFVLGQRQPGEARRLSRMSVGMLGLASLSGLVGLSFWLTDGTAFLYQGGFLTVSLVSALVIFAATRHSFFSRLLSLRPLRWLGLRSYAIYLWHWPIYMLAWPNRSTTGELILQVTAIVAIAAVSYALVETPVREGGLGRAWQSLTTWSRQSWRFRGATALAGTAMATALVGLVSVAATAKAPETPSYFQAGSVQLRSVLVLQDVGSVVREPTLMGRVQTTLSAITTDARTCPSDNLSPGGTLVGVASTPFGSTCPHPIVLFAKLLAAENKDAPIVAAAREPSEEELASVFERLGPERQAPEPEGADAAEEPEHLAPPAPLLETTSSPVAAAAQPNTVTPSVADPAPPAAPPPAVKSLPRATAIGDSVMLGAAYALAASIPGIDLDAEVGRQASAAVGLLQQKAAAGVLGDVVVAHIGNNGTLTLDQFDQLMAIAGPDRTVVVLSLHVPRPWEASNNAVILDGAARYTNAILVDWAAAVSTYPEMLYNDGIHLTPAGAAYYAQMVVAALG